MKPSAEKTGQLLEQARLALGMTQKGFGEFVGVSSKTVQRWASTHAYLAPSSLTEIVAAVDARDPALAKRIAAAYGKTLEELGVARPPAPRNPSDESIRRDESVRRDESILADALVCAAAEVADVSPRLMRPALIAALARAREARLTIEEAHALLAGPKTEPKKT